MENSESNMSIEGAVSEPLLEPRNGLPELIIDQARFLEMLSQLENGSGPIAVDAERASGYRYSQRAYLIQIFRRGGGLHLVDPIAVNEAALWTKLSHAFADCEWIIHASTQDLPCLRELGLEPRILFDTELGGRIAGCERVGLGPLCESLLGLSLAKEHSAVDWSLRPLRSEWLIYAALDVDVLVDLRDEVEKLLLSQGKLEWAKQDFAQILKNPPAPPRIDPWRRTSGMHKVKDRMTAGLIKTLWQARDSYAREIDCAPGRIFNDEVLIEVVTKRPTNINDFAKLITKRTRLTGLPTTEWFELFRKTTELPESELPPLRIPSQGLPPIKLWAGRNPLAHARHSHARVAVTQLAADLNLPVENLISPETLRQLVWKNPPAAELSLLEKYIEQELLTLGARPWQVSQVVPVLIEPLLQTEPLATPEAASETPSGGSDTP